MVQSNIVAVTVSATSTTTSAEAGYIVASPSTVSLSEDLEIEGHDFLAFAPITLYDSLGGQSTHSCGPLGNFNTGEFSIASVTQSAGVVQFWAVDTDTGYTTPSISVTVTSPSTTSSGYVLPPSEWTGTGAYGSNTNPVAFGNWAVLSGTLYGINWYGAGYYQNADGSAEMYFSSSSDALTWLGDNGYPTEQSEALGSQDNPYSNDSWQGPGYYEWPGIGVFDLTTETEYENMLDYGQPNIYNALDGWQGDGYYDFPSSLFSIPATGLEGKSNPVYMGSESVFNSIMADYNG